MRHGSSRIPSAVCDIGQTQRYRPFTVPGNNMNGCRTARKQLEHFSPNGKRYSKALVVDDPHVSCPLIRVERHVDEANPLTRECQRPKGDRTKLLEKIRKEQRSRDFKSKRIACSIKPDHSALLVSGRCRSNHNHRAGRDTGDYLVTFENLKCSRLREVQRFRMQSTRHCSISVPAEKRVRHDAFDWQRRVLFGRIDPQRWNGRSFYGREFVEHDDIRG